MTLVTVPQNNPNDEITADSVNQGANAIAAVVNGNLDDTNIASLSGTKISAGTIAASKMTTDANPETRLDESLADFVASGLVWSTLSGLNGAMTSGVAYVDGKRLAVSAVATYAFTASRDTYVYITSAGAVSYDPKTNGTATPTTPANSVLVAKVVTNGSAITSISAVVYGNAIKRYTDTNGWTVIDHNAYKRAFKKVSNNSFSLTAGSLADAGMGSSNLPVGISTVASLLSYEATARLAGSAGNVSFTLEGTDASTELKFTCKNNSAGTVTQAATATYEVTW